MQTLTLHVSDETAQAIAVCAKRHAQVTENTRQAIAQLVAHHPGHCDDPLCMVQGIIDAGTRKLAELEAVERFHHDVLVGIQFAKSESAT